ncbi:MAG TPA: GTP cyclohydrolase I, partial [Arthrobacter sp.]|nr:GTP cyclohydrolase I [Arthrobacter sp.]
MTSFFSDNDDSATGAPATADSAAAGAAAKHAGNKVDRPRIEAAVREILLAIGEDPDRSGLLDTPKRVAKAYSEMFAG